MFRLCNPVLLRVHGAYVFIGYITTTTLLGEGKHGNSDLFNKFGK
jgi:hypothetical protein